MVWPEKILRQFQLVSFNPQDADFHGPYNKLLCYLFPADSPFTVVQQFLHPGSSLVSDYILTLEVFLGNRPVFVLVLKAPTDINDISARRLADEQIRRRLGDLGVKCPIPTLHAVSAMGTRLCFYNLDTTDVDAEIVPRAIPPHPTGENDTAPEAWWNHDILDAAGEATLRAVVDEIQQACKNIAV